MRSSAMPDSASRGTSLFSMPPVVPSQLTLQPRRCISRATASPGITCPPVPAAMMTRWLIGAPMALRAAPPMGSSVPEAAR